MESNLVALARFHAWFRNDVHVTRLIDLMAAALCTRTGGMRPIVQ